MKNISAVDSFMIHTCKYFTAERSHGKLPGFRIRMANSNRGMAIWAQLPYSSGY
ncbi:MAG: hypothetical protein QXZ44_05010 [Ferroplasma sp.]